MAAPGEILTTAKSQDYFMYTHNGGTYWMGPVGYDSTSTRYYCIEEAMPSTMRIGSVSPLPDSPQNRRLAALLHKYQHVHNSDYTQTALAIIMHDAFDTTTGAAGWAATRETLQQYPQLFKRVDELLAEAPLLVPETMAMELLAEAPLLVPETMAMELEYDDVARTGAVRLRIHNSDGDPVSGIPFTLTIDGPARFGNGSATVSGTSGDYTTVITWHATGDGPVAVSGNATLPSIDRIISSQDMVALGSGYVQALDEVTVPVRTTFNPTISTRTSPKSIDRPHHQLAGHGRARLRVCAGARRGHRARAHHVQPHDQHADLAEINRHRRAGDRRRAGQRIARQRRMAARRTGPRARLVLRRPARKRAGGTVCAKRARHRS